jgi:hypothetical protein
MKESTKVNNSGHENMGINRECQHVPIFGSSINRFWFFLDHIFKMNISGNQRFTTQKAQLIIYRWILHSSIKELREKISLLFFIIISENTKRLTTAQLILQARITLTPEQIRKLKCKPNWSNSYSKYHNLLPWNFWRINWHTFRAIVMYCRIKTTPHVERKGILVQTAGLSLFSGSMWGSLAKNG